MRHTLAFSYIAALTLAGFASAEDKASRSFDFTYFARIAGLPPGKAVKVWVPVPQTTADQTIKPITARVRGKEVVEGKETTEPTYGNRIFHATPVADDEGTVRLTFVYNVQRREVKGQTKAAESAEKLKRFLQADALVPVSGKPLDLIAGKELPDDPMKKARRLYDLVNDHMTYSKEGTGWGRGDSAWACDSKFGNCSDFHSLFISLARSQKLPAKFEMGFPIPEKRGEGTVGGYHCWAFFRPEGKEWVPVDISEANKDPKRKDYYFGNLTPDRVGFSTGRDIDLVPKQAGKPVNFLIYPYVEVEGKEWPQEKITKAFSYKDVK